MCVYYHFNVRIIIFPFPNKYTRNQLTIKPPKHFKSWKQMTIIKLSCWNKFQKPPHQSYIRSRKIISALIIPISFFFHFTKCTPLTSPMNPICSSVSSQFVSSSRYLWWYILLDSKVNSQSCSCLTVKVFRWVSCGCYMFRQVPFNGN